MKKILSQFQKIKLKAEKEAERETTKRLKNNPIPTEEEIYIGAYREMIEPQVRDAIFTMNRKGYSTESSGFYYESANRQDIDGNFIIDKQTREKLKKIGVRILDRFDLKLPGLPVSYTRLEFKPKIANTALIKKQWDEIADILPDKKIPMSPSISGGSMFFRQMLSPERLDIEKIVIEKMLKYENMEPLFYKPAMEYRLKVLTKLLKK